MALIPLYTWQELLRVLLDALERELRGTPQAPTLERLYRGECTPAHTYSCCCCVVVVVLAVSVLQRISTPVVVASAFKLRFMKERSAEQCHMAKGVVDMPPRSAPMPR